MTDGEQEIDVTKGVYNLLKDLDQAARARVIEHVMEMFKAEPLPSSHKEVLPPRE